jgi:response regulator of citrate/malate metabolism
LIESLAESQNIDLDFSELSSQHTQEQFKKSQQFFDLLQEGFTYQDIAELHNVSEGTVRRYLKAHPDFDIKSSPVTSERKQKNLKKSKELGNTLTFYWTFN